MNHTRHLDLFNFPPFYQVVLVGAGGIGAVTAMTLVKMGVPMLDIFDDDHVDETNLPGQLHRLSDVGKNKASALADSLLQFGDDSLVLPHEYRFQLEPAIVSANLVISAVDSIGSRKNIWEQVAGLFMTHACPAWYIDARMAAEQYQHFVVDLNTASADRYAAMLDELNEADVPDLPCTAKATFFTAATAAGHLGTTVRNILKDEQNSERLVHYIPQNFMQVFNI